jgi:release factor glutamine methyltransferase
LCGGFDLAIANPPYLVTAEIATLAPEVARFEPRLALDGGPDGLRAYRALGPEIARLLRPGGWALLEVGAGQADRAAAILAQSGLDEQARHADLGGVERCLVMAKAKKTVGSRALPV